METQNPKQIIDLLRNNIQKVTQNINNIDGLILQIGGPKDSDELRKKLNNIQISTKDLLTESQNRIKELHNYSSTRSGDLKSAKERLTDELIKIVQRFQNSTRTAIEKQKAYEIKKEPSALYSKNDFSFDTSEVFQKVPSNQLQQKQIQPSDDGLQQVIERQHKFQQLESDIVDLNSVFKDLAVIVHEQGEIIDNIEDNIMKVEDTVVHANTELKGAVVQQCDLRGIIQRRC